MFQFCDVLSLLEKELRKRIFLHSNNTDWVDNGEIWNFTDLLTRENEEISIAL